MLIKDKYYRIVRGFFNNNIFFSVSIICGILVSGFFNIHSVYAYHFDGSLFWVPTLYSKLSSDLHYIFGSNAIEMTTSAFHFDIRGFGASAHWRVSNFGVGVQYDYSYVEGANDGNSINIDNDYPIKDNLGKHAVWISYTQFPNSEAFPIELEGSNTQVDVSKIPGFSDIYEKDFDKSSHNFIRTKTLKPSGLTENAYDDMQIGYNIVDVAKQFYALNFDWSIEFGYTMPFVEIAPGFVNTSMQVNEVISRVYSNKDDGIETLEVNNGDSATLKYTSLGLQFGIGAKQRFSKSLCFLLSADGMYVFGNEITEGSKNPKLPSVGIGMSDNSYGKMEISSIFDWKLKIGMSFIL